MDIFPIGDVDPTRSPYTSVVIADGSLEMSPEKKKPRPFTIRPIIDSKIIIYPGTVNGTMAKIGAVNLDDVDAPKLTISDSGPVYLEITYTGPLITSIEVMSGTTLPADTRMVKYRQIGTVNLDSGVVYVIAQLVFDNIVIVDAPNPFYLEGFIEGGDAKIYVRPGIVNNAVPKISGISLVTYPAPSITVTGTDGIIQLKATIDDMGSITALIAESVASLTSDDPTHKYKTVGTWTSASGAFTSVISILNTNQTLYICGGTAIWEA